MVVYREFIKKRFRQENPLDSFNIIVVTHPFLHPSIQQTLTRVCYVPGTVLHEQFHLLKNLGSCESEPDVCLDDDSV